MIVLGLVMMVVFGSTKNCNLVEWTQEKATRNCKAKFANKAFGVRACPGRYQNRLEKSLANKFFSGCRSRCVYDIESMITDAKGAFVYKKKKKCWRFVKKGKCFKLNSYGKVIQRAKKMCPAKVVPTHNPTLYPTGNPTVPPTGNPTVPPTGNPTKVPTNFPTANPTSLLTGNPTVPPTGNPTVPPTENPTVPPTNIPTRNPTYPPIGLVSPSKGGYENNWDQGLKFEAGANRMITGMHSVHNNWHNDRRFGFYTKAAKGFYCNPEGWTSYVNEFDKKFTFECPNDKLISGIYSVHDNYYDDRRFKFQCCRLSMQVATRADAWSGYKNAMDKGLDFQCDQSRALKGVSSQHANWHNDRQFAFRCSRIIRR